MLYALVVVYNKSCDDSQSLASLKAESEKIRIIVFDNSTGPNSNRAWCEARGYTYMSEGTNIGLSKAYNHVLRTLKKTDRDYIMILDDDTCLPESYFQEVYRQTETPDHQILLPIVMSGNLMMSPCKMLYGCKSERLEDKSQIDLASVSAINSGMVVRLDVYEKFAYDENLFLDCVDHDFMNQARLHGLKIHILESVLQQNFSMDTKGSVEGAVFRFNIQKRDLKVYYKKYRHPFISLMDITWVAMKMTQRYRTTRFLRQALKP